MFICEECGRVTENPDADFCYHCGSDGGSRATQQMMPQGYQPVNVKGGGVVYADRNKLRRIPLSLLLALVPGLFDIFGLGHLIIGRWFRGAFFLALSGGYYYLRYMSGWEMLQPYLFVISLAIFVLQMVDLYNCYKVYLNDSVL